MKVVELHKSVTASNDTDARALRDKLTEEGRLLVNIMSAAGSGKTTLLGRIITDLKDRVRIAVIEADIDASVDAERIESLGARSIQAHTDGMCHMDAGMTAQAIKEMDTIYEMDAIKEMDTIAEKGSTAEINTIEEKGSVAETGSIYETGPADVKLLFLENVGNLICPAEYDTGAHLNVMLLSVPEGDDKPLKYPLMFQNSDALVITKTDALPYFNFNMEKCMERARALNPGIRIFPVSAKSGQGMEELEEWILQALPK